MPCSSGVENLRCAAFRNPDGNTAIVYLNDTNVALTTKLPALAENGYSVYVTDETHDLEKVQNLSATLEVPSMSVVTVVFEAAEAKDSGIC